MKEKKEKEENEGNSKIILKNVVEEEKRIKTLYLRTAFLYRNGWNPK